jgi:GNAT superfamily N-acetyltransferase
MSVYQHGDFIDWCRTRYAERAWAVEKYFPADAVEKELAALNQAYAAPHGAILLALVNDMPAGCVALRTIGDGVCEMKRLFIREPFHGLGLGRGLCEAMIALARKRGFRTMRLEVGDMQPEALALYRALGFAAIAPYYDPPADLRPFLTFMEKQL